LKRSVNTHSYIEQEKNHFIKIKDEERLLFIEVTGTGPGIKKEDFILLKRNGRTVKYLVYQIDYKKEDKFKAELIMINYET